MGSHMKEKSVVVNVGMAGHSWDPHTLDRKIGTEVADKLGTTLLEGDAEYCITWTQEGKIAAVFYATEPDAEEWTAKVTMTAMQEKQSVTIRYWNRIAGLLVPAEAKTMKKTANSAGIFEAKLPLEGADLLLIQED